MKRLTKYLVNVLVVFYLSVIYFTGVPETNTLNSRLKKQAMTVAFASGIWPSWSMFAPNPIRFDSKSYVEVTHKNGEIHEYDVEIAPTGLLAPFRKARWMKYSQDNLRSPKQRGLLAPAARYFANKYHEPENPVIKVVLKRKWMDIRPFSNSHLPSIFETPRKLNQEILLTQNMGK